MYKKLLDILLCKYLAESIMLYGCLFCAVMGYIGIVYCQYSIQKQYNKEQKIKVEKNLAIKLQEQKLPIYLEEDLAISPIFIGESRAHDYSIRYLNDAYSGKEVIKNKNNSDFVMSSSTDNNKSNELKTTANVTNKKISIGEIFNRAVKETNTKDLELSTEYQSERRLEINRNQSMDAISIYDLPDVLKNQIPKFEYSAHNYSSTPSKRSVTLNGHRLSEGDVYKNLTILEIKQHYVIMRIKNQSFSVQEMDSF
ncbi:MAG: general secretion pathway protein GspB [Succinivibrionaceae bacterium]